MTKNEFYEKYGKVIANNHIDTKAIVSKALAITQVYALTDNEETHRVLNIDDFAYTITNDIALKALLATPLEVKPNLPKATEIKDLYLFELLLDALMLAYEDNLPEDCGVLTPNGSRTAEVLGLKGKGTTDDFKTDAEMEKCLNALLTLTEEEPDKEFDESDIAGKVALKKDTKSESENKKALIEEQGLFESEIASLEELVTRIIDQILDVYDKTYAPLEMSPALGVLCSDKVTQTDKNGNTRTKEDNMISIGKRGENKGINVHKIPSLQGNASTLYNLIKNTYIGSIKEAPPVGEDSMCVDTAWLGEDGVMKYNYAPHIQLRCSAYVYRNEEGVLQRASSYKQFRQKFQFDVVDTIYSFLRRINCTDTELVTKALDAIFELYTTVFLVNNLDMSKMIQLTLYCASCQDKLSSFADLMVTNKIAGKAADYYIVSNENDNNVQRILLVTNKKKYDGEIQFAYKLFLNTLEHGGKLDISNVMFGYDLEGKPYSVRLSNTTPSTIGLLAGPRSGKGVLSLALLMYFIGNGLPFVYADVKPEMAITIWDYAEKVGGKVVCVDANGANCFTTEAGWGIKSKFSEWGVGLDYAMTLQENCQIIPYLKLMQVVALVAYKRVNITKDTSKKFLFVMDEAMLAVEKLRSAKKGLSDTVKTIKKAYGKEINPELERYLTKIETFYNSTVETSKEIAVSTGPKGQVLTIVIGQGTKLPEWGDFGQLVDKAQMRILGTGTANDNKLGMSKDIPGSSDASAAKPGYFGMTTDTGKNATKENTKVIKTALVLNDNDYNETNCGPFTKQLLDRDTLTPVLKDELIHNELLVSQELHDKYPEYEVGTPNPLVGFEGLADFILKRNGSGLDMATALSSGYEECAAILTELGLVGEGSAFPCNSVQSYLYSAHPDTVYTLPVLRNALTQGKTVKAYLATNSEDALSSEVDVADNDYLDESEKSKPQVSTSNIVGFTGNTKSASEPTMMNEMPETPVTADGVVPPMDNVSEIPTPTSSEPKSSWDVDLDDIKPDAYMTSNPEVAHTQAEIKKDMSSLDKGLFDMDSIISSARLILEIYKRQLGVESLAPQQEFEALNYIVSALRENLGV